MTSPKIAFVYLLNRMENAASAKYPSAVGFGEHRKAVIEHVSRIETELADARAALSAFTKTAQKYHDDCGHGQIGSVAECDAICDCLPAANAVLAKLG